MSRSLRPVALLFPLLVLACSRDATEPVPEEPEELNPAYLSGPRGYGFRIESGDMASAVLDGTRYVRCTDSDNGYAVYTLQLSTKMVDEMWDVLNMGGTVAIEVITQHTFTGEGEYSYSENITIEGPGIHGSHSNQATASSPGRPSIVTRMEFEEAVTANDMGGVIAGGVITISLNATAQADLAGLCGEIKGGQVMWKTRGAILWLLP